MKEKVQVLPEAERPRCKKCGKPLPRGRKAYCYDCQPLRPGHNKPHAIAAPTVDPAAYTIQDRCAQARAHGLSYGQLMAKLCTGEPLPPMLHKVRWPRGSNHRGE